MIIIRHLFYCEQSQQVWSSENKIDPNPHKRSEFFLRNWRAEHNDGCSSSCFRIHTSEQEHIHALSQSIVGKITPKQVRRIRVIMQLQAIFIVYFGLALFTTYMPYVFPHTDPFCSNLQKRTLDLKSTVPAENLSWLWVDSWWLISCVDELRENLKKSVFKKVEKPKWAETFH